MNREIKFRGKDIENENGWRYGSLVVYPDGNCVIVEFDKDENELSYDVQPETVGQFTGLYDKTGKGIYEADRILINRNHYVVIFYKGMFAIEVEGCGYIPLRNVSTVCKVIGNVFDNPELLKVN